MRDPLDRGEEPVIPTVRNECPRCGCHDASPIGSSDVGFYCGNCGGRYRVDRVPPVVPVTDDPLHAMGLLPAGDVAHQATRT